MRLSRLLKLSFIGTLLFSPSMAQEASQVHEEALKVLRSGGDTNRPATRSAAPAARGNVESREDRQQRLRSEAQQRLAERDRQQAERRRQFEEFVKERERLRSGAAPNSVHNKALETLRQQEANPAPASATTSVTPAPARTPAPAAVQPAPAAPVAQPAPAPAPRPAPPAQPTNDEVQQRALEILRQQREQSAAPTTVPRESEVAPRTIATPSPAPAAVRPAPGVPGGNNADTHQKALEVLRQQTQTPASASVPSSTAPARVAPSNTTPSDELKPSPDLQRRLDEMKRELDTPQPRSSLNPADPAYTRDLEQRALQMMQQQRSTPATATATTPAPAPARATPPASAATVRTPAPATPARTTATTAPATSVPTTVSPPRRSGALDPAAESRAREILRQQQQAVGSASAATSVSDPATSPIPRPATSAQPQPRPQPVPPAAPVAATPVPASPRVSTPTASGDVNYSQELENRARQALLERSQPQQTTASAEAQAAQAAATAAAGSISTTPVGPDPNLNSVHSRAIETLVQVKPGEGGQTEFKSKRERLRALTDLYKADRLTPAEYHQRRAKILAEPNE